MAKAKTTTSSAKPRLESLYLDTIRHELKTELGYKNLFEVPKLTKIVINSGVGKAKDDKKMFDLVINNITKIAGQAPIQTAAKNSIAGFKLREGNKIGVKVTLRKDNMYYLLDRLINIILPRLRDFHGVSLSAFDRQGNYSLGFSDQSIFPELTFDETTTIHGLQINFIFRTKSPKDSTMLLKKFGMPFEKEKN